MRKIFYTGLALILALLTGCAAPAAQESQPAESTAAEMSLDNEMILNFIYEVKIGGLSLNASDRESMEQIIKDALGETDVEDILLAPLPIFNETIQSTFGMTVDELYALPFDQTVELPSQ